MLLEFMGHTISVSFPTVSNGDVLMAFTLRTGGCSQPPYASFNFSSREGDSRENVIRNLKRLSERLEISADRIAFCRQVHSDSVCILESMPERVPEADAIIATAPKLFPAVKTADCLPVLLLDPERGLSAAVHAGWKGTVLRITRKVVLTMQQEFGTNPNDLLAALGPSIGSCCYEVDEAVLRPFRKNVPHADKFIVNLAQLKLTGNPAWTGGNGKPLQPGKSDASSVRVNLAAANFSELTAMGVPPQNIHVSHYCTACHEDLFFSHRRDSGKTGRHVALVGFRGRKTDVEKKTNL